MKTSAELSTIRPDALRWAIFLGLLVSTTALADGGLQPTPGPGGTALINDAHGVPIIDIVAPNAGGLSHNQYLDYNVGQPGLVMNNATAAGQSQLAGALAANPQFQGQAASTILNEVISSNASMIEGAQEIFGRPADYILANPNGITVNGGSFINTTRAGFLVGTPAFQDQQVKLLDTLDASGSLVVLKKGLSNSGGTLDLIAPHIETVGPLEAEGDLTLTLGRNRIDARDGSVVEHRPPTEATVDAALFGAMRAGRIRIHSTAEGAGVRMTTADVQARGDIVIRSAGKLIVGGSQTHPNQLTSEHGKLSLEADGDINLRGVKGSAEEIDVKAGGTLTLDARSRESTQRERETWDRKIWFVTNETYDRERTETDKRLQGTELRALYGIAMQSGGDTRLLAAKLEAGGDLRVDSGGKLGIEAGVKSSHVVETIRHRKNLWRGDSDTDSYKESAKGGTLSGAKIALIAREELTLKGSSVDSRGDTSIKARHVDVVDTALKGSENNRGYRGDLVSGTFFGNRDKGESQAEQAVGSSLLAGGGISVVADSVRVRGSKIDSTGDAVLYSEKAGMLIESAQSTSTSTQHNSESKVFGLVGKSSERTDARQEALVSDLKSSSNLRLASAEEIKIHGAKISAVQDLQIEAKGPVEITSAESTHHSRTEQEERGFTASAGQTQEAQDGKPGSKQYDAAVGYQVAQSSSEVTDKTQVGSEIKGGTVSIASDAEVTVSGSTLTAETGDLDVRGTQLNLTAAHDEHRSEDKRIESGGGLAVSGGMDRVGSAWEGHRNEHKVSEVDTQVKRTEATAAGNINIVTPTLVTEAARLTAGKELKIEAQRIDNLSAHDTHEKKETTDNWSGTLGASLEYRDITRPIERLVNGEESARFQQAGFEDAMAPPSIGADATVAHLASEATEQRQTAQVTELSGATIDVKAKTVNDTGTQYRADGTLKIQADKHTLLAAKDSQTTTTQRLEYNASGRVDTSTGEDINIRLAGKGGSQERSTGIETARPGSLEGQMGIQTQLGSDGLYEGTAFNAGAGSLEIAAGGDLKMTQATNRSAEQIRQTEGNGWAKLGNRPTSAGIDARGYLDHAQSERTDTQAHVGQIDAKGDVKLTSGADMLLEGTRIGSRDAPVANLTTESNGVLAIVAAHDTHQAKGNAMGGGMEIAVKGGDSKGGALGGNFGIGRIDEQANTAVDASFTAAERATLVSHARDEKALHVQGLQASAGDISLQADKGGMLIEASDNSERYDNLSVKAGVGFAMATGETPDKDARGLHGRVQVEVDKRNNHTWNNSQLRADKVSIDSLGDTRLEGVQVQAQRIEGQVGGDLRIASRKDSVDSLTVKVDARLSHEKNPQGYVNAASALAGPAGGKVAEKAGPTLSNAEAGLSPSLEVAVSHIQRDTVAQQTTLNARDGIALEVGGDVHLTGARLQSVNGSIELGSDTITRETLSGRDYRRDVNVTASNAPADLGGAIIGAIKDKGASGGENALDLGLIRTSGHDRNEQWPSTIQEKKGH